MNFVIILYSLVVSLLGKNFALAQSLSAGSNYNSVFIKGQVELVCQEGSLHQESTFECQDSILEPSNYAYFLGPRGLNADEVRLVVTSADGSSRNKNFTYHSKLGSTTDKINLWISTVFQKALLKNGLNKINYSLLLKAQPVNQGQGQFQVQVNPVGIRYCPAQKINSSTVTDCNSQYSVCQTYFQQNNFCR